MPYDPGMEAHIREALARFPLKDGEALDAKKMFGGLCFMLNGKMFVGLTGNDHIMVRLSTEDYARELAAGNVAPMDFSGRPLKNFAYLTNEDELDGWIARSAEFVRASMFDKPKRKAPSRRT